MTNSRRSSLVSVGALGGTIAMTPGAGGGVAPSLGADDLVAMLGSPADVELRSCSLAQEPSASLSLGTVQKALEWARTEVGRGAAGVVLTQGTDTLEEVAFCLDLFWDQAAPLVVTGAMRHPTQPGADGLGNLAAALAVAREPSSQGRGALVVMGDVIHRADRVRKAHTSRPDAFISEVSEGLVIEDRPVFHAPPWHHPPLAAPVSPFNATGVHLVEQALDDDGELVRIVLASRPRGLVVGASGAGHVSVGTANAVSEAIDQGVPVVVASRVGAGTTLVRTYGYAGSEMDLIARGAVMAGWLGPHSARLLLVALLAAQADGDEIGSVFRARGSRW